MYNRVIKRNEVIIDKSFYDDISNTNDFGIYVKVKLLLQATNDFFKGDGSWYGNCFRRSKELEKGNLPCNLRDDEWIAKMLKIDQDSYLSNISYLEILNFIKSSKFYLQKRHEYEQKIVKWQINWMMNGGGNWIGDPEYGSDFWVINQNCDLGFRKGVVDTLSAIGLDKEAIEEGLETNASLWRKHYMKLAFMNKFRPYYLFIGINTNKELFKIDNEFLENWLKIREYEYYQRHKNSVDKYNSKLPSMFLSNEELSKISNYLKEEEIKNLEILKEIEEYQKKNRKDIFRRYLR